MSNWRHKPEDEKALQKQLASVKSIVAWVRSGAIGCLVIGVGILKGGTGKSTTVLYIALWLSRVCGLRVAVVDTDDNSQSLARWCIMHRALGENIPFTLVEHRTSGHGSISLKSRLKKLRDDYDVVLVDLGGGDKETFIDLCVNGHLLLMPSAPSGWETSRVQATLQTAASAAQVNPHGLSVYSFFVKCNFNTTLPEEQREVMSIDLSAHDEDHIVPTFLGPYFDVGSAPHYPRSWEVMPNLTHLEEFSLVIRHAMQGVMEEAA
jgi:chromosome partitioning protein